MPDYSGISPGRDRWVHEQVADAIRAAIDSGEYQPGRRLPSWKHIAQEAGVSEHTVQNALKLLRDEKAIYTRDRLGTFVSPAPE